MPNYMTFIFDAASIKALVDKEPDYFLMNVGSRIIDDPENPDKKLAVLTVDAQAFKTSEPEPLLVKAGCPSPPCKPTGGIQ